MTSDEFRGKYKLLKQITEQGVTSYTAVELAGGRPVMVHVLDDSSRALLAQLDGLPSPEQAKVIDVGDVDGTMVIVTQFLQGFEGLAQWISARAGGGLRRPMSAAVPPA